MSEMTLSASEDAESKESLALLQALRVKQREWEREEYLEFCREQCTSVGLHYNAVRAAVWPSLVLDPSEEKGRNVPFLSDAMIVKSRRLAKEKRESRPQRSQSSSRQPQPPSSLKGEGEGKEVSYPPRRAASHMDRRKTKRGGAEDDDDDDTELTSSAAADTATYHSTGASRPVGSYFSHLMLPENCQPKVIDADIQRSLWGLYPEASERTEKRKQLKEMLFRILANRPECYYYQGLNELMGFVLYLFSPHLPFEKTILFCEKMLLTRWKYFCEKKLTTSEALLYAMHAVVAEADPKLAVTLEECGVGPESHYAVSWIITWYAHCINNTKVLARLFDYFVVEEDGLSVLFFTAALVVGRKERIADWVQAAYEEAGEIGDDVVVMARVYANIITLPQKELETISPDDLNDLLQQATHYREQYYDVVLSEQQNFLEGNKRKLGLLADRRTRNVALRLLWHLLPREWRTPSAEGKVRRLLFWSTGVLLATTAVLLTKNAGAQGS